MALYLHKDKKLLCLLLLFQPVGNPFDENLQKSVASEHEVSFKSGIPLNQVTEAQQRDVMRIYRPASLGQLHRSLACR